MMRGGSARSVTSTLCPVHGTGGTQTHGFPTAPEANCHVKPQNRGPGMPSKPGTRAFHGVLQHSYMPLGRLCCLPCGKPNFVMPTSRLFKRTSICCKHIRTSANVFSRPCDAFWTLRPGLSWMCPASGWTPGSAYAVVPKGLFHCPTRRWHNTSPSSGRDPWNVASACPGSKKSLCCTGKNAVPGLTATDGQMAAALAPLLPGHATCPEVWAVLSPAAHGTACNNSEEFPKPGGGLISGCFSPPPTFEADSFVAGGRPDVVGSRGICRPVSFASYGRGAGGGRSVSAKQERMSTGALATFSCHGCCTCGNKVLREACRNSFLLAASAAHQYKLFLHSQQSLSASCIQLQHLSPAALATPWSG